MSGLDLALAQLAYGAILALVAVLIIYAISLTVIGWKQRIDDYHRRHVNRALDRDDQAESQQWQQFEAGMRRVQR